MTTPSARLSCAAGGASGGLPRPYPPPRGEFPPTMPIPHDPAPGEGPSPTVLGVLGGIASGKSAVARLLAGEEGIVVSADELAHGALAHPEVLAAIREAFGEGVLGPDGEVDRPALAREVFSDPERRALLESWIHPRVRASILTALEEAEARRRPRVVLDIPLLLENDPQHGLVSRCDHLIFVDAPAARRDQRAVLGRGWEPGEVARREALQLPLSEKRRRADAVIVNDGSLEELAASVRQCLADLGLPA